MALLIDVLQKKSCFLASDVWKRGRAISLLGITGLIVLSACHPAKDGAEVTRETADVVSETAELTKLHFPEVSAFYQARVKRAAGHHLPICDDANSAACSGKHYLVPGDIALVSEEKAHFLLADFINSAGIVSQGWVSRDGVEKLSPTYGETPRWDGEWVSHEGRDARFIAISKSSNGLAYTVTGDSTFGRNYPDRVERGGVNIGSFSGNLAVENDRAEFREEVERDEFGCEVMFRKFGLFLIANDNGECGGNQVSFSGVYRELDSLAAGGHSSAN